MTLAGIQPPLMARLVPTGYQVGHAIGDALPTVGVAMGINIGSALWSYGAMVNQPTTGMMGFGLFAASALTIPLLLLRHAFRPTPPPFPQAGIKAVMGSLLMRNGATMSVNSGFPVDDVEGIAR